MSARAITIDEYAIPTSNSNPFQIVAGPDGNLWFTESAGRKVGRITPGGVITEFPLPNAFASAGWIAAGPDGNLWFTEDLPGGVHRIGRITPSGAVTEFPLPIPGDSPYSLIAGKDGALWYLVAGRKVGKVATNGTITEFPLSVPTANQIGELAADTDGSVKFVQLRSQNFAAPAEYFLGRLTPDGMFTESSLGLAKFYYITHLGTGPDGSLWYSTISGPDAFGSNAYNGFRRLNASGSPTFIPTGSLAPLKFTVGPDGNFWFLANSGAVTNRIGRATIDGAVTQYETGGVNRFTDLTAGPDGKIWLIDPIRNVVGKLTPDSAGSAVVTRAASFVGGAMAPDSIAALFGSSLATTTERAVTVPLPTTLAGVSVKVRDSAAAERTAPLFFVSPSQVNFLIPSGTSTGNATVTVTSSSGQTVTTGTLIIDPIAPSLFSANATGKGLAAAVVLRIKADGSQTYEPVAQRDASGNFVAVPIDLGAEGDQVFLILFGSGVRGNSDLGKVSAHCGGGLLPVAYAGPQGSYDGLDQVNLRLTQTLTTRGEQDVVLTVADRAANPVRVNIK